MALSVTHAAFEGFRLIGRRPVSILVWSLVSLIGCAALVGGVAAVAWPNLSELSGHKGEVLDHAELMRLLGPLAVAVAVATPILLLFNGVLLAALYRAVLRPQDGGIGFLRLGGDEFRQVAVMLLQTLLAVLFVGAPLAVVHLGVKGAFGDLGPGHWAGAVLAGLVLFGLYLWVSVRLSLAAPMTFSARRVRFFGSWSLTRGRFWALVCVYLLALVLSGVVYYVGSLVADAALAALGGTIERRFDGLPDMSVVTPELGAGLAIYVVLQVVLSTVQFVLAYGAQASACAALQAERNSV